MKPLTRAKPMQSRSIASIAAAAALLTVAAACSSATSEAEEWISRGQYEKARDRLRGRLREAPDDHKALLLLGSADAHLGRRTEARDEFKQVLKAEPGWRDEVGKALFSAAQAQAKQNNDGLALGYMRTAAKTAPDLAENMARWSLELGRQYAVPGGDFERGLAFLVQAGLLDKRTAATAGKQCVQTVAVLPGEGQGRLVRPYIERCVTPFGQGSPDLLREIGLNMFRGGDLNGAFELLRDAVGLDPGLLVSDEVAFIVQIAGRQNLAFNDFESWLRKFPESRYVPDVMLRQADELIKSGDRDKGEAVLKKIVADYPGFNGRLRAEKMLSRTQKFLIDETFSRPLDPHQWRIVSSTDGAQRLPFSDVKEGRFEMAGDKPARMMTGLESGVQLPVGTRLTFRLMVLYGGGDWRINFAVNTPVGDGGMRPLCGTWKNHRTGSAASNGEYAVRVDFVANGYTISIDPPTGIAYKQTFRANPPYRFAIAPETATNGTVGVAIDDIRAGAADAFGDEDFGASSTVHR